ncbi:MAG: hypothetical protein JHC87_08205, partial [Thermoleophilaceae bacterium]|nr:hypothetical protein [Thermoleophilaceae bacterium]
MIDAGVQLTGLITPLLAHAGHIRGDFSNSGVATLAWLTLLTPLAGALLIGLGYRKLSERAAGFVGTLAIFMAFGAALAMLITLIALPAEAQHVQSGYRYADV